MKNKARKFISLLVVFTLLCSMIPTAFAATYNYEDDYGIVWTDECDYGGDHDYVFDYCNSRYEYYYCLDCDETGRIAHDWQYEWEDAEYHLVWCSNRDCDYYWDESYEEHDFDDDGYCYDCEYDSYYYGDYKLDIEKDDNLTGTYYEYNDEAEVYVYASLVDEDGDEIDIDDIDGYFEFDWEGDLWDDYDDYNYDGYSEAWLDTTLDKCEVECTVYVYDGSDELIDYDTVSWSFNCEGTNYDADFEINAVVYNTSSYLAFNERDDEGGYSIEEQILDAVYDYDHDYELDCIVFDNNYDDGGSLSADEDDDYYYEGSINYNQNTDESLSDIMFYPEEDYVGEAVFYFTAYCYDEAYDEQIIYGVLVIDVQGEIGASTYLMAISGEDVELDEDLFVEFWANEYPNGTLDYVTCASVSSGKVYDGYTGSSNKGTNLTASKKCYLDPTSKQIGLGDITYVPASKTTSATIEFTAYGTEKSTSKTNSSMRGTIVILYTKEEVTDINYKLTDGNATLDADDFTALYKEVMGVSSVAAKSLTIQLLEAPIYGNLHVNYSSKSSTKLTSKNVSSYTFSASATASRSIEDVTYVAVSYGVGETIRYACYYNNTLKFIGTICFGAIDPVEIEYTSAGEAVKFSGLDFSNNSALSNYSFISFGTPSSGALYKNYSNGIGISVTSGDIFINSSTSGASALNNVTFVPPLNYIGVVEIPFYAYTLTSSQTTGTVKIYMGRKFTDVLGSASAWAAPYINKLSAQGIVNGTDAGMTKYSPTKTVTYGEALKLIMMAAGYPEQAMTNTHWASGYLTKAYYDGLVSSTVDLNAEVTRDTIASITAKALGLSYASSVNYGVVAPTDSTNGYVYALYNAGIVNGTYNAAGQNVYNGSNPLTRAEISKIICTVSEYYEANN